MSWLDQSLDDLGYAVVDVETTGFVAGLDQVVEICVAWVDPGVDPVCVLDTLVDPRRPIPNSTFHGISDADVAGAPTFDVLAGDIVRALAGRVVVGHNVGFDLRVLRHALLPYGVDLAVPYVDTMALRPALGDGPRATLGDTMGAYGLRRSEAHIASADVLGTTGLLLAMLNRARFLGRRTLRDLVHDEHYAFQRSLSLSPVEAGAVWELSSGANRKSRSDVGRAAAAGVHAYGEALLAALADGEITAEEVAALVWKRAQLGLDLDQVRGLHAQLFAAAIVGAMADARFDDEERRYLNSVAQCLRQAGWCPGD